MTDAMARMNEYLLEELSDEERSRLEREYFADAATFERILQAETDLIDRYVRGRLSADERQRFEHVYLRHPRRLERVRFAEALAAEVDRLESTGGSLAPSAARRLIPMLAVAASLLLAIAAGILWFRNASLRREMASVETARAASERQLQQQLAAERARVEDLRRELGTTSAAPPTGSASTASPRPAGPLVVSLLLRAASERTARAAAPPTVTIPPSARTVHVDLEVERFDYRSFQLFVRRVAGGDVYSLRNAPPRHTGDRDVFTAVIPADRLPDGDYILTLRGQTAGADIDDLSRTLFRVSRPSPGQPR